MTEKLLCSKTAVRIVFLGSILTTPAVVVGELIGRAVPDNKVSLVVQHNNGFPFDLALGDLNRNLLVNLTKDSTGNQILGDHSVISPTNLAIAYEKYNPNIPGPQLCIFDLSTNNSRCITPDQGYSASNPSWSPDGAKITFTALNLKEARIDIRIINSDGTGDTLLVENASNPSWSPNNDLILFNTPFRAVNPISYIKVVKIDGSEVRELGIPGRSAVFAPDGSHFTYVGTKQTDLYLTTLDNPLGATQILSFPLGETIEVVKWLDNEQMFIETIKIVGTGAEINRYLANQDGSNLTGIL